VTSEFKQNQPNIMAGSSAFFLERQRSTRTPKHFVNLTGQSKNFNILEFPLNQLQTYCGYFCVLLTHCGPVFFPLYLSQIIHSK
jgi:hypothetical protein